MVVDGRWSLMVVDGRWLLLLVVGCWLLVGWSLIVGRWVLGVGCWVLDKCPIWVFPSQASCTSGHGWRRHVSCRLSVLERKSEGPPRPSL